MRVLGAVMAGAALVAGCVATVEPESDGEGVARGSAQALAIASGLRGYYPFDGNALDESGYGNNGVVTGATSVPDRFGNPASAYRFNAQSRIRVPSLGSTAAFFDRAFTISFWMRSDSNGRMYAFSVDGTGCASSNLNIELNDASGIWAYWNSAGTNKIQGGAVDQFTDGRWHHVLFRRSGSTLDLFVDATGVGSTTYTGATTIGSNTRDLYLGVNACFGLTSQTHGFSGDLDDLSLYARALSNQEIQLLHREGLAGAHSFTGNANDESGFANHGTTSNATATTDRFGNAAAAYSVSALGFVQIPRLQHASSLFDGNFTLSFWAQSDVDTSMSLFSIGPVCGSNNLTLELNASGVTGIRAYWNGNTPRIEAGAPGQYTNNVWRHIALRRDKLSSLVELFVDGLRVGWTSSTAPTIGSNTAELFLGKNPCDPLFDDFRFAGKLDDLEIHARALGDGEIKLLASSGMVASYRFEGGVVDDSGNGTRAIVGGGYNVEGRDQAPQSAFRLFGEQYIKIPPLAAAPRLYDRDFSIAFWMKSSSSSRMYALSIDPFDGNSSNLNIELNDGSGVWAYWNGPGVPGERRGTVGQFTDGTWHHVALVRKASSGLKVYIDEVERISQPASEAAGTIGSNNADLYLGLRSLASGPTHGWQGEIDDFQIYNRAISTTELSRVRNDTALRLLSPAAGVSWAAGSTHHITWAGQRNRPVKIEYTPNGGTNWYTVAASAVSNRFAWTVPATASTQARVRITAVADASIRDETKANFAISPSQQVSTYRWSMVTPSACYSARDGAGALVHAGKMFLLGGWNPTELPKKTNNQVWRSTDGAAWSTTATPQPACQSPPPAEPNSIGWPGRHTAGYVVHNGQMWIVGGDANRGPYQNDVWKSSSTTGAVWTNVMTDPGWKDRALHYTVTFDPLPPPLAPRIWVLGGQKMAGLTGNTPLDEALYGDIWSSSDGASWVKHADGSAWAPRGMISGSVVFGGKLWLLGGGTYETPRHLARTYHQDVWSSPDGITWDRVVDYAPWPARQYINVAVFDNKMWVLGGFSGVNRNDVWYSSDGVNWYELPNPTVQPDPPYEIWQPTHAASVFVFNNALWMSPGIGDTVDPEKRDQEVWKLSRP